jgi:PAS domain-containing protein
MRLLSRQIRLILFLLAIPITSVSNIVMLRSPAPLASAPFVGDTRAAILGPLLGVALLTLLIGSLLMCRRTLNAQHRSAARRTAPDMSEQQHRIVAERATDVIALTDEAGRICYASPSFHSVLGYAPASAIGVQALTLQPPYGVPLTVTQAELWDSTGAPVPIYSNPPDCGTACYALIPTTPLQQATTYTAHATGTIDGVPFDRSWSFTTTS